MARPDQNTKKMLAALPQGALQIYFQAQKNINSHDYEVDPAEAWLAFCEGKNEAQARSRVRRGKTGRLNLSAPLSIDYLGENGIEYAADLSDPLEILEAREESSEEDNGLLDNLAVLDSRSNSEIAAFFDVSYKVARGIKEDIRRGIISGAESVCGFDLANLIYRLQSDRPRVLPRHMQTREARRVARKALWLEAKQAILFDFAPEKEKRVRQKVVKPQRRDLSVLQADFDFDYCGV